MLFPNLSFRSTNPASNTQSIHELCMYEGTSPTSTTTLVLPVYPRTNLGMATHNHHRLKDDYTATRTVQYSTRRLITTCVNYTIIAA